MRKESFIAMSCLGRLQMRGFDEEESVVDKYRLMDTPEKV